MAQGSAHFETTLWGDVLLAAREPTSNDGQKALSRLCEIYWYPVYVFLRHRGFRQEDAKDLTQGFFEHVLSTGFLARADPERGRFRNFMLGAVKHFVANTREKENTQRRGGTVERISIDAPLAEQWLAIEPSVLNDPTRAFDHSWAVAMLNHVLSLLEDEQQKQGKGEQFILLKEFIQRPAKPGEYDDVAAKLGITKGAVAAAVHRLNGRFGELVRKTVRDTVESSEMAEDELRFLFAALRD